MRSAALRAHSQSKLANVIATFELTERLTGDGIPVNALHSGVVASSFGKSNPELLGRITGGVLCTMRNGKGRLGALVCVRES